VTGRTGGFTRLFGGVAARIILGMTKAAKVVLADALRLGPDERAELAVEVLASLDGPADQDAESAWKQEISRRVQAIEAGTVELESWDDVKRRIEKEILGR
jgi:putative addiction module component (TIGR02574 family)